MKQIITALFLVACTTATAFAQGGAEFKFKEGISHDFGTLKEGPEAAYDFEFTNVGKEPLIIVDAKADCGCTTPEWPKQPILPGKSGKITVRYTTKGHVSPFSKHIYVKSNAKVPNGNERYELTIKGTVVAAKEPGTAKN